MWFFKFQQSFILEFEFATNPHFSNQILTKKYILRPGPDPVNPLAYEGPEIISCEGYAFDVVYKSILIIIFSVCLID